MLEALEKAGLVTDKMRSHAKAKEKSRQSTNKAAQKNLIEKDERQMQMGICIHCEKDQKIYKDKHSKTILIAPHSFQFDLCPGSHQPPEKLC